MTKYKIIGIVVGAVLVSTIFVAIVKAETSELTPEKQTIITQTCVLAQTALQRVQHNDTATRVNRGQGYETLLSRLMTPLNARATSNGYNDTASSLVEITKRYQQALDDFKDHYKDYDNSVSSALRIKCKNKPAEFYGFVEDVRKQRQVLASDVDHLSRLISEYRISVIKLQKDVE